MKKELIVLIGCIGSGKSYFANTFNKYNDYNIIDLSDYIRDFAWSILGWKPKNEKEYEIFKKKSVKFNTNNEITGRRFLQNLGTGTIGDDTLITKWLEKVRLSNKSVIVSDVRRLSQLETTLQMRHEFKVKIYFTNYKSERYDCTNEDKTEKLAQYINQKCDIISDSNLNNISTSDISNLHDITDWVISNFNIMIADLKD